MGKESHQKFCRSNENRTHLLAVMASDCETRHSSLLSNLDDIRALVESGLSTLSGDIAALCEQVQCLDIKVEEKVARQSLLEEDWNLRHAMSYSDDVHSSTNELQIKTSEESTTSNLIEQSLSEAACKSHYAPCMQNFNGMESSMENELKRFGHNTDDVNTRMKSLEKR